MATRTATTRPIVVAYENSDEPAFEISFRHGRTFDECELCAKDLEERIAVALHDGAGSVICPGCFDAAVDSGDLRIFR